MGLYLTISTASNLSAMIATEETDQHEAIMSFQRSTSTATVAPVGTVQDKSDYAWPGGAGDAWLWFKPGGGTSLLLDPRAAQINASGTVAWSADQPMGTHKFTGLAAGTAAGHSVRYEQVMLLSGANTMAADLDLGNHKVVNLAAPAASNDAVRLGYVKDQYVYFQTNRDLRGNSRPVKIDVGSAGTADYVDVGFQPRKLRIFFYGRGRRQSDNANLTDLTNGGAGIWVEFDRPESDATAGFTAAATQTVAGIGSGTTIDVTVTWSASLPAGFLLTLKQNGTSSKMKVRNAGDSADGVIQILAFGGPSA